MSAIVKELRLNLHFKIHLYVLKITPLMGQPGFEDILHSLPLQLFLPWLYFTVEGVPKRISLA